ncbi:MAG: DUF2804 domain-containing protein [Acidimicrobiia bacterium]
MTHEREITTAVDLCDAHGRLNEAARGWSRRPLHRANLRGSRGRKKRWDYWCVISEDIVVTLTYADVDYLGLASLWVLDQATGEQAGGQFMVPFGLGFDLPDDPCTGTMRASGRGLELEIRERSTATHLTAASVRKGSPSIAVDIVIDKPADHDTMNVVIPWTSRRFQYTSKHTARPAVGSVTVGPRTWTFGPASRAFGVLDLGRGIWKYSNRWNWAAASGQADDGAIVGLQFGGKWTDGTGFTENALCIDGHLTKIGEELEWTYSWDDPMQPWRVRTTRSDQVDVTLTPMFDRHDRTSLGILSMEVHQCFGTWSGRVAGEDGTIRRVDGLRGFAEEARNRW